MVLYPSIGKIHYTFPKLETVLKSKYTNKTIGNTAFMLLNKPIGQSTTDDNLISGPDFAEEVYTNKSEGRDVKIKINCIGGQVSSGWDMVDSIIETKAKTECIGVAYSMAGIALAAGSYRTAYPHARAMIHGPRRVNGKGEVIEDNSEYMTGMKNQFVEFLKNHTKFTEAETTDMVTSGKDYFFTAKQMKEKGIIDEIVPSNGMTVVADMSDYKLYDYCNQLIEQEQNLTIEMEILAKLFGGKTESDNLVSAVQMKAENETLKSAKVQQDSEIVALKAEVASLKAEKGQTDLKVKAAELIENAVKAGKFPGLKAEDKAKMVEGAIANYDSAKIMVDSIPTGKSFAVAASAEGKKPEGEVTYEWLMKNNPTELARIAESDEELFKKLQDGYIQAQKEEKK